MDRDDELALKMHLNDSSDSDQFSDVSYDELYKLVNPPVINIDPTMSVRVPAKSRQIQQNEHQHTSLTFLNAPSTIIPITKKKRIRQKKELISNENKLSHKMKKSLKRKEIQKIREENENLLVNNPLPVDNKNITTSVKELILNENKLSHKMKKSLKWKEIQKKRLENENQLINCRLPVQNENITAFNITNGVTQSPKNLVNVFTSQGLSNCKQKNLNNKKLINEQICTKKQGKNVQKKSDKLLNSTGTLCSESKKRFDINTFEQSKNSKSSHNKSKCKTNQQNQQKIQPESKHINNNVNKTTTSKRNKKGGGASNNYPLDSKNKVNVLKTKKTKSINHKSTTGSTSLKTAVQIKETDFGATATVKKITLPREKKVNATDPNRNQVKAPKNKKHNKQVTRVPLPSNSRESKYFNMLKTNNVNLECQTQTDCQQLLEIKQSIRDCTSELGLLEAKFLNSIEGCKTKTGIQYLEQMNKMTSDCNNSEIDQSEPKVLNDGDYSQSSIESLPILEVNVRNNDEKMDLEVNKSEEHTEVLVNHNVENSLSSNKTLTKFNPFEFLVTFSENDLINDIGQASISISNEKILNINSVNNISEKQKKPIRFRYSKDLLLKIRDNLNNSGLSNFILESNIIIPEVLLKNGPKTNACSTSKNKKKININFQISTSDKETQTDLVLSASDNGLCLSFEEFEFRNITPEDRLIMTKRPTEVEGDVENRLKGNFVNKLITVLYVYLFFMFLINGIWPLLFLLFKMSLVLLFFIIVLKKFRLTS